MQQNTRPRINRVIELELEVEHCCDAGVWLAQVPTLQRLKTYAISVALEGNGQRDYTEMQYDALIALLQDRLDPEHMQPGPI